MWPEINGKKGSQEVSTCLAKFIDENVPHTVKKLNFFADNCPGITDVYLVSHYSGTVTLTIFFFYFYRPK